MLLAMPVLGFIIGYATGEVRKALVATAALFVALLAVVSIADDGILDDGGAFYLAADAAVSLGLAWLGVALRTRRDGMRASA